MQVTSTVFLPLVVSLENERFDDEPVHDELLGDLVVVYSFGPPYGSRLVTWVDLDKLGLSHRQLRQDATINLDKRLDAVKVHGQPPALMLSFDGIESSLLLADSFWAGLADSVPGELVIGLPARDVAIITGSESKAGLEKAKRAVDRVFFAGDDHLLTRDLLVRRHDSWEPLHPRKPGAAAAWGGAPRDSSVMRADGPVRDAAVREPSLREGAARVAQPRPDVVREAPPRPDVVRDGVVRENLGRESVVRDGDPRVAGPMVAPRVPMARAAVPTEQHPRDARRMEQPPAANSYDTGALRMAGHRPQPSQRGSESEYRPAVRPPVAGRPTDSATSERDLYDTGVGRMVDPRREHRPAAAYDTGARRMVDRPSEPRTPERNSLYDTGARRALEARRAASPAPHQQSVAPPQYGAPRQQNEPRQQHTPRQADIPRQDGDERQATMRPAPSPFPPTPTSPVGGRRRAPDDDPLPSARPGGRRRAEPDHAGLYSDVPSEWRAGGDVTDGRSARELPPMRDMPLRDRDLPARESRPVRDSLAHQDLPRREPLPGRRRAEPDGSAGYDQESPSWRAQTPRPGQGRGAPDVPAASAEAEARQWWEVALRQYDPRVGPSSAAPRPADSSWQQGRAHTESQSWSAHGSGYQGPGTRRDEPVAPTSSQHDRGHGFNERHDRADTSEWTDAAPWSRAARRERSDASHLPRPRSGHDR